MKKLLLFCLLIISILSVSAQAPYHPDNIIPDTCYALQTSGNFGIKELASLSGVDNMTTPIVGDIDNDGKVEILVMNPKGASIKKGIRIYEVDPALPPAFSLSLQETIETPYISQFSPGPYAIADVDGDGFAEIFFCTDWTDTGLTTNRCHIIKYKWNGLNFVEDSRVSYETPGQTTKLNYSSGMPYIVDFNGDGIPEIQVYNKIFNAQTLTLLATCPTPLASGGWGIGTHFQGTSGADMAFMSMMTCGDVDGDGVPEVIGGNCVYKVNITNPSGTAGNSYTLWSTCDKTDAASNTHAEAVDGATSIADIDGDGKLDIVVSVQDSPSGGAVYVWNPRTKKVMHTNTMVNYGNNFLDTGPSICSVGDIDGDKKPEICFNENPTGIPGAGLLHLLKLNGTTLTELWSITTDDLSGATGTSLFDFNNDGSMEIVYRAEHKIMVLDAAGNVLFQTNCTSDTGDEYPVIADVNADGEAEIVVCGSGKIWIYGSGAKWGLSTFDPWATARPVWNQYAYNSVNINENLTVPTKWFDPSNQFNGGPCHEQYPFNGYLMQQSYISGEGCKVSPLYDLIVNITDSSYNQTTHVLTIKVDLINQGLLNVSNVASTLYLNSCDLVANALGTVTSTGTLQHGDTIHNVTFTVTLTSQPTSTDKFIVRTNDDVLSFPAIADECEIKNNTDTTMFELYVVKYDGNSPTLGFPPDDHLYSKNDPVTVLGNIGDSFLGFPLSKTNSLFLGWSTTQLAPVISAASDTVGSGFKVAGDIFTIIQDTTLYAVWAPDSNSNGIPDYEEFTVIYNGNGHTLGDEPVDGNTYPSNASVTVLGNVGVPPSGIFMTKPNSIFLGWSTTQHPANVVTVGDTVGIGFKNPSDVFTITQDTTLYAVWADDNNGPHGVPDGVPDLSQLHVTYDANYPGAATTVPVDDSLYSSSYTPVIVVLDNNLPTRPGYAFRGWSFDPTATLVGFFTSSGPNFDFVMGPIDTVLYAVWAPLYNVTYDGNGNTVGAAPIDGSNPYLIASPVTVLDTIGTNIGRTNAVFVGWNTSKIDTLVSNPADTVGTGFKDPGYTFLILSDTTFYAIWASDVNGNGIPDYNEIVNVTYDLNGGQITVPLDPNNYHPGNSVTVLDTLPGTTNTDAVFLGWSTTPVTTPVTSATDTVGIGLINPNNTFVILGNTILYAVWAADKNHNGIPDIEEVSSVIEPVHPWTPIDPVNPELPEWTPEEDNYGYGSVYAGCEMNLILKFAPDPVDDRTINLHYFGALSSSSVFDTEGNVLDTIYTLAKGDSIINLTFLIDTARTYNGEEGGVISQIVGGLSDTTKFQLYSHPDIEHLNVYPYYTSRYYIDFGITGGTPNLLRSINGQSWRNAYLPLTASERIGVTDGAFVRLREPWGCWEIEFVFRSTDGFIQRYIHIPKVEGVSTFPSAGKHYVAGHDNFSFSATYTGAPLKVTALGYYSATVLNLDSTAVLQNDGSYLYTFYQVVEPWTVSIGPEYSDYITGNDAVAEESISVWSFGGTLYLRSDANATANIYTLSGALYKNLYVQVGTTKLSLPRGIYVVVVNGQHYKVIIK